MIHLMVVKIMMAIVFLVVIRMIISLQEVSIMSLVVTVMIR